MTRDLWNVCLAYGNVVGVYIPLKKSKAGKKFAFVPFIRVDNLDRLIGNLCTIWIGRLRLHANSVRFQREPKNNIPPNNSQPRKNVSLGVVSNSFAEVLKSGTVKPNLATESSPTIVLDDSCIIERDFSCSLMGKIKDINAFSNLYNILANEGFEKVKLSYLGGHWVLLQMDSLTSKEKIFNHVGVGSWFEVLKPTLCVKTKPQVLIDDMVKIIIKGQLHWICVKEREAWIPEFNYETEDDTSSEEESEGNNDNDLGSDNEHVSETNFVKENDVEFQNIPNPSGKPVNSEDPFEIYKLLKRHKDVPRTEGDTPQHPPGFTPIVEENVVDNNPGNTSQPNLTMSVNIEKASSENGKCNHGTKFLASGSILEVMDELIKMNFLSLNIQGLGNKAKKRYIQELNTKHRVNFIALQENKMDKMDLFAIKSLWGNLSFDYAFSPSIGFSRGIICVWDPSLFVKDNSTVSDSFLAISDQGRCNDELIQERSNLLKELQDFNKASSLDMAQKAKIRITFASQFPNLLSTDQIDDLERNVSYDEIKRAVWDCGISKSPAPDGFTFEFYRKYWNLIDHDVVAAVTSFFSTCSFISLIPKSQEAKMVKDFRPISLIAINGGPTSEFKFSKGLKQGDPLSPFLCIMVMESLHLSFNNVVNSGLYNGIHIYDSLRLSHLFYADDVIFVGKWNLSNLSTIVNVLKWFQLASGLQINLYKSKLMGIGIPNDVVASTARSIGCSTLHTPFNYLGVKEFCIENEEKKMSLICWNKILASKKNGGLSVSSFFAFNRALLLKWIWQFIANGSSLWSRFISAIYGVRGALDTSSYYSRRSPWLDIVNKVRKLFIKGIDLISLIKKKVGNGEATSFWNDVWLGDSPLKQTYTRLYFLELDKHASVASKLRDNSHTRSFRRSPRSGIEEEQLLLLLISNTSSVTLPNISDKWTWRLDSSGVFSVKSEREFIDDYLLSKADVPTRRVKSIPIKINIFAWRVSLDKLPTRLNLSLRGLDIPSIISPLCSIVVESSSHLLFSCQLARQLLFKVAHWWELEYQDFLSYDD
ncbi:RNA-directed DNA polymerase, eukaryota, reverse transcriptase zinc-binding domain protein [Tanacetum coccineum]|uniref:RNA-directed DNA polymerase, eukaryota, reverse transcriptase zinc-binding domain protein n=1 Tax=Tanacetum coccineum TaxID=301880 RepID=A0ABQ5C322_9ASTR